MESWDQSPRQRTYQNDRHRTIHHRTPQAPQALRPVDHLEWRVCDGGGGGAGGSVFVVEDGMSGRLQGTFACPICGVDTPHAHREDEQRGYWEDQIRRDGWNSFATRTPKESGWYLCNGITVPPDQQREPKSFGDYTPKWSQLN